MTGKFSQFVKLTFNPKTLIGLAISGVGIYWAFKDFNFQQFSDSVRNSEYQYIILAGIIVVISVWVRAVRWEFFFRHEKAVPVNSLYKAEMIGYFGNSVLPLRLGELLRAYMVRNEHKIPMSFVLGTVVLERLLDTLGLMVLAVLLLFVAPLPDDVTRLIKQGALGMIGLSVLMIPAVFYIKKLKGDHWIITRIRGFFSGFRVLEGKYSILTFLITFLLWGIYWVDVYMIQKSLGLGLGFSGSLVVLVVSSLAYSIPSAPGTIGTFHLAVKYVMVSLIGGYTPEEGITFAVILHAYSYIIFTLLGGWYFFKSQFHHGAISHIIEKQQETR